MKKKWITMLVALTVAVAMLIAACGGTGDPDATPGPADGPGQQQGNDNGPGGNEPAATLPPERDLGGLVIRIASWYDDSCTQTIDLDGASYFTRLRWEDRAYLEQRYNFRIIHYRYGGWDFVRDMMPLEIAAGNRDYQIWTIQSGWFMTEHANNAFAPIPGHWFNDDLGIQWNRNIQNITTFDGQTYGFFVGSDFNGGLFFNQRLLEEAGIDPELPFDLQMAGEWTWDAFVDILRAVQAASDVDGDGVPLTWPLTSFHQDFLEMALPANNAAFVRQDESGRFINSTLEPQFLETIEWMISLREERLAKHEMDTDAEWNFFENMFNAGQGAFRAAFHYRAAGQINPGLADPWGFVAFPTGPSAAPGTHFGETISDIYVIPHFFSPEEIDDFMFAFSLWHRQLPGAEDDDWILAELVNQHNPRSVHETMRYFTFNQAMQAVPTHRLIPGGIPIGDSFAFRVWTLNEPASVIMEEAQQIMDDRVNRANTRLFD